MASTERGKDINFYVIAIVWEAGRRWQAQHGWRPFEDPMRFYAEALEYIHHKLKEVGITEDVDCVIDRIAEDVFKRVAPRHSFSE